MKIASIFSKIIRLVRSLVFCFRFLPLQQAVKIPICVGNQKIITHIKRGQIKILGPLKRYRIIIGGGGSPGMHEFTTCIWCEDEAELIFKGTATIAEGTVLRCDRKATITIGDNFYCNKNNYIRSSCRINFEDNCCIGWGNTFNTTDGHKIGRKNCVNPIKHLPINIGKHVWITTECNISKGCNIPQDCIIAQKSVVTKSFFNPNTLIGGIPAKEITANIQWEK